MNAVYFPEVIISLIAILIVCLLWNGNSRKKFPPGPKGLPIVGIMPFIHGYFPQYLANLSRKYGSVFSLKMGNTDMVVLNDWKSIKEVLKTKSDLFAGRPNIFLLDQIMEHKDLVTSDGPLQKEVKQFCVQHLRNFGLGKSSMEEIIKEEITKLLHYLDQSCHNKIFVSEMSFSAVLNIIGKITTGTNYEIKDNNASKICHEIGYAFATFSNCAAVSFMPFFRFIPGATCFQQFIKSYRNVDNIIRENIEDHVKTFTEGIPRDFIDCYLSEILKRKNGSEEVAPYTRDNLRKSIYSLTAAAVETTDGTLSYLLLMVALLPEIQHKVQKEIDDIIGFSRQPTYTDKKLLPYTEATILEVQRYITIGPLSFPHAPLSNANLGNYVIPKGTYLLTNFWAIDHDKDLWGDPDVFRPERFIDENNTVQKPEYFIPFSSGARVCIGESLARMELFLFFTTLLQRYSLHCVAGETSPNLDPVAGITIKPKPFYLTFKYRK